MLSPERYDANERNAQTELPNRLIEAFQPEIFNFVGYPTRVASPRDLWRYVDVMHETGFPGILEVFLKGLTHEEFELIREVTRRTYRLSEQQLGKKVLPRSAVLWAILALRHVRGLFPNSTATILEVGPGSGYLGAFLGLLGYNYVATDVTQAMYLWQSQLWTEIMGPRFVELASDERTLADFGRLTGGTSLHVPWWKFASPEPESLRLDVDCVVCVDVFAEMHVFAMRYLGRQCARWLRTSSGNKAIYVQGTGAQLRNSMTDIIGALRLMSFDLAYSDQMELPTAYAPHDMFYFFAPNDRPYVLPQAAGLSDEGMRLAVELSRKSCLQRLSVDTTAVRAFYEQLTGSSDNDTDDEKFWNFCNGPEWRWY